jgi:TM2 domain-containing membrane protein YozV
MDDKNRDAWFQQLKKARPSDRNWWVAVCLSVFLGVFGADRFYLGYTWSAVFKLATFGGVGLWYVIDLVLLFLGKLSDADGGELGPPWM